MKTIVIRPEIIGFDNTALRDPQKSLNYTAIVSAALLPVVAIVSWAIGQSRAPLALAPAPAKTVAVAPAVPSAFATLPDALVSAPTSRDGSIDLQTAMLQNRVQAEFNGNGRNQLTATVTNPGPTALRLSVSFGQMLENSRNAVVVVRTTELEVAPGQTAPLVLQTAATRSLNRVGSGGYRLSSKTVPKIDLLLAYIEEHRELSPGAIQTAVLALTENLPISAICAFTPAGHDLPSNFNTNAFRVETLDIIAALAALREIGVKDRDLALTIDPQLKAEAMIEPLCRAAAMRYYGIAPAAEWDYWKSELLSGDPTTRHYALFGIARFYPSVALEMLPTWVREKRTTQVFRLTAVQALAETQRPEALPILRNLVDELGRNTELGRTALESANFLDARLNKTLATQPTIAFRSALQPADF